MIGPRTQEGVTTRKKYTPPVLCPTSRRFILYGMIRQNLSHQKRLCAVFEVSELRPMRDVPWTQSMKWEKNFETSLK